MSPADSPPAAAGDLPPRFGPYCIERLLGAGGMGSVYLATDTRLDRLVALKVPRFTDADGADVLDRFEREAKAAGALDHPNLCTVHDAGRIDGRPYLTMAFVDGRQLADYLRGKPLPVRKVALLIRKVALGLAAAHGRGIVHRDLKPANVMLKKNGEPIVTDFGLARRFGRDDRRLTQSGHVMGTLQYMAPEQVRGEDDRVGPATDIWALGVILYECLTGQLPFDAPGMAVVGDIVSKDPVPPTQVRPDIGPALEAACLKALAKEPADRFSSMSAFALALADAAREESTGGGDGAIADAASAFADLASPGVPTLPAMSPTRRATAGPTMGRRGPILVGAVAGGVVLLAAGLWAGGVFTSRPVRGPAPQVATATSQSAIVSPPAPQNVVAAKVIVDATELANDAPTAAPDRPSPAPLPEPPDRPALPPPPISAEPKPPAAPARSVEELLTPAALRLRFKGRAAYDPKSGELTIAYDFSATDQLQDFTARTGKLTVVNRSLLLDPAASVFHSVRFKTLNLAAILSVKQMSGKFLETSEGTIASLGGANPDTLYLNVPGQKRFHAIIPKGQRTGAIKIGLVIGDGIAALTYGTHKLGTSAASLKVGRVSLHGGEQGYGFSNLVLKGTVDPSWANEFFGPTPPAAPAGASPSPSPAPQSPPDAVKFGRHSYKMFIESVSWTQAKERCERMGGRLACPDSDEERQFLVKLKGNAVLWLGGTRSAEGEWHWLTGKPVALKRPEPGTGLSFGVREDFHGRPDSGFDPGRPVKNVKGFICEWDN
jgi:hypothetical protein